MAAHFCQASGRPYCFHSLRRHLKVIRSGKVNDVPDKGLCQALVIHGPYKLFVQLYNMERHPKQTQKPRITFTKIIDSD